MDFNKEWTQLNEHLFSNKELKNDEIMNAITSESSSAIYEIKKGLKIKSWWCLSFIGLFSTMMFISRKNMEAVIAIGIVNLIYIFGFIMIGFEVKKMKVELGDDKNVLESMKRNAAIMQRSISAEKNTFILTTPIIVLCAMFYSGFTHGATFDELIHDSKFLTRSIVFCMLSVPFVSLFGGYLNKKSFGPHINQLNANISKLEGVEMLKSIN